MIHSKVRLLSLSLLAAGCCVALGQENQEQDPTQPPGKESSPTDVAQLDSVTGYGGLTFGSDFSKAEGLVLEQDRGPLKIYKKKDEKLLLGPALLETILYYYFEGKLYGIAFHTNDGQDTLNMKEIFSLSFGAGQNSADEGPSTIWIGKKNGAIFDINTSTGDGSGFIFNHQLHDAYLKYESDADKKAAEKLIKGTNP